MNKQTQPSRKASEQPSVHHWLSRHLMGDKLPRGQRFTRYRNLEREPQPLGASLPSLA